MKFINSETNKDYGFSAVVVENKGYTYWGTARLHPDDEWSEFFGCRLAEMRAKISALKDEHREAKARCEECRKFVEAVKQYKNFDSESPTAKAMFRQLNRRIIAVNRIAEEIAALELEIIVNIKTQDEIKTRLKAKADKNN